MFIFSKPHPGLMGCMKRLPDNIKQVIDEMDGCRMSLAAALCKIGATKADNMQVQSHSDKGKTEGWIELREGSIQNPPLHSWKLINYSEEKS